MKHGYLTSVKSFRPSPTHPRSGQLKDTRDVTIGERTKPAILSILVDYALQASHGRVGEVADAAIAYAIARDYGRRDARAEPTLAKDAEFSLNYALYVIHGRFELGEPAIAKKASTAYEYAHFVLKNRWPEAEPVIAKSPDDAVHYAINVIKGRWPEAEPVIARDPFAAVHYAERVIKGRWPEAEPAIARDKWSTNVYARDVVKGKFP